MREPVVVLVGRDLLLVAAVGLHAPDLHPAGAIRVEVDGFAVGGELWAVVQPLGRRQAFLLAAFGGNAVYVELAVALTAEDERLAVRRPAVPVGWPRRRDELGRAAGDRQRVDERLALSLGLIA